MRVISLLPAGTEIIAFLGATEHLVGITHACDFPDVVRSRARVTRSSIAGDDDPATIDRAVREGSGSGNALFELDEKLIRALHPDVIVTQALCEVCAVSERDVRAIAESITPAPQIVTLGGTTLDGIYQDIAAVAESLGIGYEAEELIAGLRERVSQVHRTLKAASAPRPRVAVIEWPDPVYVAGHWGPEQVKRAGGIDVAGTAGAHSVTVPIETLIDADPEIVIVAPCGYSLERSVVVAKDLVDDGGWQWLSGRQVWAVDANGIVSRPGPRVVEGIETMARIFNPALFSAVDPRHAVRVR